MPNCPLSPRALPLLVTGITGVHGYNAFLRFHALYPGQVFGLRPWQTSGLDGPHIVPLDANDGPGLLRLCVKFGIRAILNCVGNCALKACELDPAMAQRLNVDSAAAIAHCAHALNLRLVHVSSDLVFSGANGHGGYVESDPVDPVTVYGKTMVAGEEIMRSCVPHAAILRISLPMGPSFNRHAGAIDWIDSRFRAGRPATLYFDEVRSVTYCDDLNRVFAEFLNSDAKGLYHCGGPRPITLFQIAQIVNRVGGYAPALLHGCPRREAGPMPPRAGNVSMNSTRLLQAIGYNPFQEWPAQPTLWPADRLWHATRGPEEAGGKHRIAAELYRAGGAVEFGRM